MCRWAAWRGAPLFLEDILVKPAHSLIAQSNGARHTASQTHGDGFGVAWYGERPEPGHYRDVLPAWSDRNLKSLAGQIRSPLFLAHVRASTHGATARENCHPFVNGRWSFMHNGHVAEFSRLERRLESHLSNMLYQRREGATDSELLFLLAVQIGLSRDPAGALSAVVALVAEEAAVIGVATTIRLTCAFSDGRTLFGVRYASAGEAPSLFIGEGADGTTLASEPFERPGCEWRPVPPMSFVTADERGTAIRRFDPLAQRFAMTA
jgi:glutamine amidotransferase